MNVGRCQLVRIQQLENVAVAASSTYFDNMDAGSSDLCEEDAQRATLSDHTKMPSAQPRHTKRALHRPAISIAEQPQVHQQRP